MSLAQSTARTVMVLMTDELDHVTGKAGLTLTITASKNGGAFASISPTVTERGNGWYGVALTSAHTDTLGDLALHITGANADPSDVRLEVVEAPATAAAVAGVQADTDNIQTRLPAALVSGRMDASVGAMAADVITAAALHADAGQELADALLDRAAAVDSETPRNVLKLMAAVLLGKVTGGPGSPVFRSLDDDADRVSMTADSSGNRSAVTLAP